MIVWGDYVRRLPEVASARLTAGVDEAVVFCCNCGVGSEVER